MPSRQNRPKALTCPCSTFQTSLPDNHRELEPPDPIPNSAVKWFIADGSVGFPHVRVGHCQASNIKSQLFITAGIFLCRLMWF